MAEKPKVRRKAPAAADKPPQAAVPPPAAEPPAAPPPATPKARPEATPKATAPALAQAAAPVPAAPAGWKAEAIQTPGGAVSVVTLVSGAERSGPGGSTYARAAGTGDGTVAGFDRRRDTLALVGTAEARVEPVGEGEVAVRLPDGTTVTLRLRGSGGRSAKARCPPASPPGSPVRLGRARGRGRIGGGGGPARADRRCRSPRGGRAAAERRRGRPGPRPRSWAHPRAWRRTLANAASPLRKSRHRGDAGGLHARLPEADVGYGLGDGVAASRVLPHRLRLLDLHAVAELGDPVDDVVRVAA
jgi:hypothetical protein